MASVEAGWPGAGGSADPVAPPAAKRRAARATGRPSATTSLRRASGATSRGSSGPPTSSRARCANGTTPATANPMAALGSSQWASDAPVARTVVDAADSATWRSLPPGQPATASGQTAARNWASSTSSASTSGPMHLPHESGISTATSRCPQSPQVATGTRWPAHSLRDRHHGPRDPARSVRSTPAAGGWKVTRPSRTTSAAATSRADMARNQWRPSTGTTTVPHRRHRTSSSTTGSGRADTPRSSAERTPACSRAAKRASPSAARPPGPHLQRPAP